MPLDNKGPGGVVNSYGQRTTTLPTKYSTAKPKNIYNEFDKGESQALAAGAGVGVSGITYDGSNRCTGFTLGSVTYTITGWGSSTVTVNGSDGSIRTISFDGSGRINGVA